MIAIDHSTKDNEKWALMLCSQEHMFFADQLTEENLEWSELMSCPMAICPECGEREKDEYV